ncbi:DUF1194 domain-containing protein [Terrihabitans sp. B22-R8]|uniref:DUF1194 domain-containing protein n=1 Tax=Terrihabitans sp. B22-R8 TaxID=3425128 RepID=UPI00403CD09F
MRTIALILLLILSPAAGASAQPTRDDNNVDLELVLAVDVSYSMDFDELKLQREGYIQAITSKPVIQAIQSGLYGRIAVAYVEWAGMVQQTLLVDWQIIDSAESAEMFAAKLAEAPSGRAFRTSISAALAFSADQFRNSGVTGSRRVIDVSGDGPNNQGMPVTVARDAVLAQNIAINGLPLVLKTEGPVSMDIVELEAYYRACVVGGPGAFVVPVNGAEQFQEAVRTKLVLEISNLEPPPRFIPAQSLPVSCGIGERLWGERYGTYEYDLR